MEGPISTICVQPESEERDFFPTHNMLRSIKLELTQHCLHKKDTMHECGKDVQISITHRIGIATT